MKIRANERKTGKKTAKTATSVPGQATILLDGKRMVVSAKEAQLMEATGIEFAYLCTDKKTGKVVTVPVND